MKNNITLGVLSLITVALLTGCGSSSSNNSDNKNESHGDEFNISSYPKSELTPELKNALSYMGNEERLAYDVYQNLYNFHKSESGSEVKQLKNISENSEIKHIKIVQDTVKKYELNCDDFTNVDEALDLRESEVKDMPSGQYGVEDIQNLYNILYDKGIVSTNEALMVGCMVEVTDVEDLDKYINLAEESNATDIVEAFKVLRDGSYNHYWAFDKGLKNAGVESGCFVEGDALLTNKDGIYPQDENGHGNGNGNGEGKN